MTKNSHQKFSWMKIEKFLGKRKNWKNISMDSEIFWEAVGDLKQGEMHHCLRGMNAPGRQHA